MIGGLTMKKREYTSPTCLVVRLCDGLMDETTVPMGGSQDYTDSGDDSGGGLAKKGVVFMDEDGDNNVWSDE